MRQRIASLFVLAAATLGTACSSNPESMPVSPTSLASTATEPQDVRRGDPSRLPNRPDLVTLRGRIRDLNDRKTQFTLVLPLNDGQTVPRTVEVRVDDRTKIVIGDHLVRRIRLENGLLASVDGIPRDNDHMLAVKISLARPDQP